jgi:hypothetical protein
MDPRLSPDGKRLAFRRQRPYTGKKEDVARARVILDLYVADIGAKDAPTEPIIKDVIYASIAWAPDSKRLDVSSLPEGQYINEAGGQTVPKKGQIVAVKTRLFDLATKKETGHAQGRPNARAAVAGVRPSAVPQGGAIGARVGAGSPPARVPAASRRAARAVGAGVGPQVADCEWASEQRVPVDD